MKLEIKATITDDDGNEIVTEALSYEGSKSGVIHAVKPMGEAVVYGVSLGVFYKKEIPIKDALGNMRTIAKDVVEISEVKKEGGVADKKT